MPVELPIFRPSLPQPCPPKLATWLWILLLVLIFSSIAVFFGLAGKIPIGTAWYWMCSLVFPSLAWCVTFGLRRHHFESQQERVAAERDVYHEERREAIEFGSEPLAVLWCSYLCAMGEREIAKKILADEVSMVERLTEDTFEDAVKNAHVDSLRLGINDYRFPPCFEALISNVQGYVRSLPSALPLDVYIALPAGSDDELIINAWDRLWGEAGLSSLLSAKLLKPSVGVGILDAWLDKRNVAGLERCALIVSAQFREYPESEGSEAVTATLLGWAPAIERYGLKPIAMVHRPVEVTAGSVAAAVDRASLWGSVKPSRIASVWQAGLTKADRQAVYSTFPIVERGHPSAYGAPIFGDVDKALGNIGVSAEWFAMLVAIEWLLVSGNVALLACRSPESAMRLLIVKPVSSAGDGGTSV